MPISMPLVSSGELAAHLRDEDQLVCDCRFAGDARGIARAIRRVVTSPARSMSTGSTTCRPPIRR